jgi:arylsulfatase A-like enzyme
MGASTVSAVVAASLQWAFVWWTYAVLESTFAVGVPFAKGIVSHVAPDLLPDGPTAIVSAELSAIVLVLFAVLGGAVGGALAFCVSRARPTCVSRACPETLWSAAALLALIAAFALNTIMAGEVQVLQAATVPVALALTRMALAWTPVRAPVWRRVTHPFPVLLILVGSVFIVQPRPYLGAFARGSIEAGFVVCIISLVMAVRPRQARAGVRAWRQLGGLRTAVVVLVSCAPVLAARLTTEEQIPVRRPAAAARPDDRRPNIVLITLDTVRADHLSVYGYSRETSPFLKRWVANGATLYMRSVATSNWTLPTHASIFTGRSPMVHGGRWSRERPFPVAISERTPMLTELLAQAGYRTAGFAANSGNLTKRFGFDRGFSEYDASPLTNLLARGQREYLLRERVRRTIATLVEPTREWALFASADTIERKACVFLRSAAGRSQPFFLFLNFMDAHSPYVPPLKFTTRFPGKKPGYRWGSFRPTLDDRGRVGSPLSQEETLHLTSQYDGAIAYLDDRLRYLVELLQALGVYDNSLIIITADHGEGFGEHGYWGHGRSLYQELLHVPLVVKYPHEREGGTVDSLVSSLDLLPTVLDVIGEPAPPGIEGQSLRGTLDASRWVAAEASDLKTKGGGPGTEPDEVALFSGSLKKIWKLSGSVETYDLSVNPGETKSRDLGPSLEGDWKVELRRYLGRGVGIPPSSPVTDPGVVRRLRSLGYLQ